MKSRNLIFILMIFSNLACLESDPEPIWRRSRINIMDSKINFLQLDAMRQTLWVGTDNGLYQGKSDKISKGFSMRKVFYEATNDLYLEEGASEKIFAATDKGLYLSQNQGRSFQMVFKSSDELSRIVLSVTGENEFLYIGTQKGLFSFNLKTKVSKRLNGELGSAAIVKLKRDESDVYAATNNSLYRLNSATGEQLKIFSLGIGQSIENSETSSDFSESLFTHKIMDLDLVFNNEQKEIYLTTLEGVYVSNDAGESWDELGIIGLPKEEIKALVALKAPEGNQMKIWIASTKGVFEYQDDEWNALYAGLETNQIFDLIFDDIEHIYAATNRGIFFASIKELTSNDSHPQSVAKEFADLDYKAINQYFEHEPSVRQVQEMAIVYAEVSHKKIEHWRSLAQKKAWLPSVSTGLDRNSTERYHWDTTPNPDQLQKGLDVYDWDVSLSWNLSELIWNNDQTSIDSRSKLMVELRQDVLDEVTRLYFERRRMQIELLTIQEIAPVDALEQQMRVAELTAIIDGFTNGQFSRYIEQQKHSQKASL